MNPLRAYGDRWTEAEEHALNCMWGRRPDEEIALYFGRTIRTCENKANELGITRRSRFMTVTDVANKLGAHRNTVLQWIARGQLQATRSYVRARRGNVWSISDADLLDFLRSRAAWGQWDALIEEYENKLGSTQEGIAA
jgi:excisionase family DNA binding protein